MDNPQDGIKGIMPKGVGEIFYDIMLKELCIYKMNPIT